MSTIINFALIFLTIFISLFTVTPIMIIFSFGIPYTMYLNKQGVMETWAPVKMELVSVLILGAIFALYSWAILYFTQNIWILIIGVGIPVFMSIGKVGRNQANVSDYFSSNEKYIDKKKLQELG